MRGQPVQAAIKRMLIIFLNARSCVMTSVTVYTFQIIYSGFSFQYFRKEALLFRPGFFLLPRTGGGGGGSRGPTPVTLQPLIV